ncbi:MAG: hypothetical protein ACXAAI_07625, partial [Promethearchaeota archaeon]
TFSAPPYDMFSPYQPWGYCRMYHHVEAEKMKKSFDWVHSEYKTKKSINTADFSMEKQKRNYQIYMIFWTIDILKNK